MLVTLLLISCSWRRASWRRGRRGGKRRFGLRGRVAGLRLGGASGQRQGRAGGGGLRGQVQRGLAEDAEAQLGPEAVDLAHIQRGHELQDLGADDLAGHQDGKAGRVGDHEQRRHQLAAGGDGLAGLDHADVLAIGVLVGQEEGAADIAVARLGASFHAAAPEGEVKAGEVRQRRLLQRQRAHPPFVDAPFDGAHIGHARVHVAGDLDQHFDQVGDRRAGAADVRHEQHRVARGLVDLDAVPVHQLLVLNVSPSMPVAPMVSVARVGSSANSSVCHAASRLSQPVSSL